MDEADFWPTLERRVCRELAGLHDPQLRHWWCDGFLPDAFDADAVPERITGRIYLGPNGQDLWAFTLVTGGGIGRREWVGWSALLPADDMTGWLSLDTEQKTVKIDPRAAYPDPERPSGKSATQAE